MDYVSPENEKKVRKWLKRAARRTKKLCKKRGLPDEYVRKIMQEIVEKRSNAALEQVFEEDETINEQDREGIRQLSYEFYNKILDKVLETI